MRGPGRAGYGAAIGGAGQGGAANGMAGYGAAPGGAGTGYPHTMGGPSAGMAGPQHVAAAGGMPMGGPLGAGMPTMSSAPMGPAGSDPDFHLPTGSLLAPVGERWTGWARTSTGHFSSTGGPLPLRGRMRMGIFGADYQLGRLLAGVAVAHGCGEGAMTPAGLKRAYSAHSTLTSVHPYAALDLSEDLTLWGQAGYGRGGMTLVESHVRGQELEQAGAYRTGNGLVMAAVGRGARCPTSAASRKADAFLVRTTSDALASSAAGRLAAGRAGASRLRAALEGSRALQFAGRSLTP